MKILSKIDGFVLLFSIIGLWFAVAVIETFVSIYQGS